MVQTRVKSDCVPCILLVSVEFQTKLAIYVSCIRGSNLDCGLLLSPAISMMIFFYIFLFCNGLFTFHWLFRCCLPNKPSIRQGWQNSAQNRYKNILRPDKYTYAFPRHCDYYTILVETRSNKCTVWAILTCALGFQWLRFWRRTSLTYCHLTGQF